VPCIDLGYFGHCRQLGVSISHGLPRIAAGTGGTTMPRACRVAKSHFVALDCENYGNKASGR
jgi:hypothetical protein